MRVRIVLFAAVVTGWLGLCCRRVVQFLFPIPHFLDWLLVDAAQRLPPETGPPFAAFELSRSENFLFRRPVSAADGLARCPIAIEGPLDKLNCLLTGKISPIHAERLLNQVRRPVQAVGGLDARVEQSGPLAVGRIA